MSEWTQTDRRIGIWSATSAATIGVIYVVVGLIGIAARPPSRLALSQVDPYLAILEVLIILSAVTLVTMMAAVQTYAGPECETIGVTAFAFIICFAVLTCGVHFASLTVGRQIDPRALSLLSHQLSFEWPTLALALDLLAWNFFLGLALVFAAQVFKGEAALRVRVSMTLAGTLCLTGTLGPASGHLRIQYLAIAGYAFALPISCVLLAMLFWRERCSGVNAGRIS